MKIIKLTAENVKRLRAVEITPDGTVQVITGRNAQGKSSVLDAIWLALGGRAAARGTTRPIRDGELGAQVTLDLGALVVTRNWLGGSTTLVVQSADGATYSSPQGILDALVGRLAFDPLEFTRRTPKEQLAALLDLVDLEIDLDQIAVQRANHYQARTEVGRDGKQLEGQLAGLGEREDAPPAEQSAHDLITGIQEAHRAASRQQSDRDVVEQLRAEVRDLREAVKVAERRLSSCTEQLTKAEQRVDGHEQLPDTSELEQQLDQLEATNAAVRRNVERARIGQSVAEAREAYRSLTELIDELDRAKATALAKASFPVDGLGFDDAGVTYNGIPFSQASSAEQIRVSLAMAMALNPKLRVIRILDGSLLDADNLRLITDMAVEHDYQVWIERVADESGIGLVIEDGEVAEPTATNAEPTVARVATSVGESPPSSNSDRSQLEVPA